MLGEWSHCITGEITPRYVNIDTGATIFCTREPRSLSCGGVRSTLGGGTKTKAARRANAGRPKGKAPMDETAFAPAQTEQFALHRLSRMSLPEIPPLGTVSPAGARVTTRSTIVDEADVALPDSAGMHLLVMSPDSFNTYPLPKVGDVTIGRSGKSKIVIEDPKASREHARLFVDVEQGRYHVEDTGSANGTLVRDTVIPKRERVPVAPGEAIAIGSTVLMVQQNRTTLGHQRLWSHAYFETRLEAECARGDTAGGRFALVRVRLQQPLPWTRLAPSTPRSSFFATTTTITSTGSCSLTRAR